MDIKDEYSTAIVKIGSHDFSKLEFQKKIDLALNHTSWLKNYFRSTVILFLFIRTVANFLKPFPFKSTKQKSQRNVQQETRAPKSNFPLKFFLPVLFIIRIRFLSQNIKDYSQRGSKRAIYQQPCWWRAHLHSPAEWNSTRVFFTFSFRYLIQIRSIFSLGFGIVWNC